MLDLNGPIAVALAREAFTLSEHDPATRLARFVATAHT